MVLTGFIGIALSTTVYAGMLTPGKPTVESDRYEVPIYLTGAGNEVAALNFSLAYDPAVFKPVSVSPGSAASEAGKLVTANLPEPGNYIVVMMGLNQSSVANGEVARIVLERVGTAGQGETTLTVENPALSTSEGGELPAEGGTAAITVAANEEHPPDTGTPKPDAGKPEKPATPTGAGPQTASTRSGVPAPDAPETAGNTAVMVTPEKMRNGGTVPVSGNTKTENAVPDVTAAAAHAAEARNRLGGVPSEGQAVAEAKASPGAASRAGQTVRPAEVGPTSSLTIEKSGITRYNTEDTTPLEGRQREDVAARDWVWLGAGAAFMLLALGFAIWVLRSKTFH